MTRKNSLAGKRKNCGAEFKAKVAPAAIRITPGSACSDQLLRSAAELVDRDLVRLRKAPELHNVLQESAPVFGRAIHERPKADLRLVAERSGAALRNRPLVRRASY